MHVSLSCVLSNEFVSSNIHLFFLRHYLNCHNTTDARIRVIVRALRTSTTCTCLFNVAPNFCHYKEKTWGEFAPVKEKSIYSTAAYRPFCTYVHDYVTVPTSNNETRRVLLEISQSDTPDSVGFSFSGA